MPFFLFSLTASAAETTAESVTTSISSTTEETSTLPAVVDTISSDVQETSDILSQLFQPLIDKLPTLIFTLIFLALGMFVIKRTMRLIQRAFDRSSKIDGIMASFIQSVIKIVLYVLLVIIVLSLLDVPMTSIVAVIASAGVAIGLALQDSLSNVAGGFIILSSKPLKEGDTIEVDGTIGKVESISLLYTTMVTADNTTVYIPNSVVSGNKIINYTTKELRRVDLQFGIAYDNDIDAARRILLEEVKRAPNTLDEPAPEVYVSAHDESAVTLSLRVWTKSENYWSLHYYLLESVKKAFDQNQISIPFPQVDIHLPKQPPESPK